jgi:hypothetical protein
MCGVIAICGTQEGRYHKLLSIMHSCHPKSDIVRYTDALRRLTTFRKYFTSEVPCALDKQQVKFSGRDKYARHTAILILLAYSWLCGCSKPKQKNVPQLATKQVVVLGGQDNGHAIDKPGLIDYREKGTS